MPTIDVIGEYGSWGYSVMVRDGENGQDIDYMSAGNHKLDSSPEASTDDPAWRVPVYTLRQWCFEAMREKGEEQTEEYNRSDIHLSIQHRNIVEGNYDDVDADAVYLSTLNDVTTAVIAFDLYKARKEEVAV